MSNPISLTDQLANRLKLFATNMGLTQTEVARLLKLDKGQLSRFLDNKAGVSSEMALKIIRLTSLRKRELDLKFGQKISAKILYLQEKGKPVMKLDGSGWVAAEDCQDDPNDMGGDITDPRNRGDSTGDPIDDVLGQLDNFYIQGRQAIADWYKSQGRARPNPNGVTEAPRRISDNQQSRTAGPHPDQFSKLETAKQRKLAAETDLRICRELQAYEETAHNLEVELRRLQQSPAERKEILDRAERSFDSKYRLAH